MVCLNRIAVTPFQSTLPHGSDNLIDSLLQGTANFNPRSLTGATMDGVPYRQLSNAEFQSTLPHGSDEDDIPSGVVRDLFQSTLPCGSDRRVRKLHHSPALISIHAPSRERRCAGQNQGD